jgi:hypothetical protein
MTPPKNLATCCINWITYLVKGVRFRAKNDPGQEAHWRSETIAYSVFEGGRRWTRVHSSSLRGASFFGGIGEPHRVDEANESPTDFRGKPPRARARIIASSLPDLPRTLQIRLLQIRQNPRISDGFSVSYGRPAAQRPKHERKNQWLDLRTVQRDITSTRGTSR